VTIGGGMTTRLQTKGYVLRLVILISLFVCIGIVNELWNAPPGMTTTTDTEVVSETVFTTISNDTMYPNTIWVDGPDSVVISDDVSFTWRGSDDITPSDYLVYSYWLKGDMAEWSSWQSTTSVTFTNLSEGTYTFFVKAKDKAGNMDVSPLEETFTITSPVQPPKIAYHIYPNDYEKTLYENTEFISKKTPLTTTLCIPDTNIQSLGLTLSWQDDVITPLFHWGKDTISISITDEDYNNQVQMSTQSSPEQLTYEFTLGNDIPATIEAESPEEAHLILNSYPDETWINHPWTLTLHTQIGEHRLLRRLRDQGNTVTITLTYTYRTYVIQERPDLPPTTTLTNHPSKQHPSTSAIFTWNGQDDSTPSQEIQFSYRLLPYEVEWSPWTTENTISFIDLLPGEYQFFVKAKDITQQEQNSPTSYAFTVINHQSTPSSDEEEEHSEPLSLFATQVLSYSPGSGATSQTQRILGGPRGKGAFEGSLDTLSLGVNGSVTLGFDVVIKDDTGPDFIVFENAFSYVTTPEIIFGELAWVEVSTDGVNFARFPCESSTQQPIPAYQGFHKENVTNCAGVHPVFANVDDNDIDPFNPSLAGGDSFDLADLEHHDLVQTGVIDLQQINYVRLVDIHGDGSHIDSVGNPLFDPTGGMINGADIDAVAVLHYSTEDRG
jgi:hypothetical protein